MAAARKVIVTCAVTGSIHTPSMSEFLPVSPTQIADAAVQAIEAGAAIVHLHARDPRDGRPLQTPEAFAAFVGEIKSRCDGVINITTGGAPTMPVNERMAPAIALQPEVASLNMGSMNFGLYPMLARYQRFAHEWERPYLEGTRDLVFKNTFADIEFMLRQGASQGTRFEFECYDTAHLYNLAHFLDRKLVEPPLFVQTVFGILGGIGTHPDDVAHLKRTADRLFGQDYVWSALGAGRAQMPIAQLAVAQGGNARVGLEDSLWDGPGRLARSNADQVRRVRGAIEALGLQVATPDEARALLKLKGKHAVAF
ncbi:3-keto-5-aminohexanoate cleavage protein [Orrella sp. JC864]|uniref:3-keto-5-aminohexanoate cleavage protein n=1 Tax=Orrella sp. JC864 TaxID=3120298 RepID=UPI0030097F55